MPTIDLLNTQSEADLVAQDFVSSQGHSVLKRPVLLNAVTGIRFFASVVVVFAHSYGPFKLSTRDLLAEFGLAQIVTLFFVISGFIIMYNYSNLQTFFQWKKFISKRLARVFPTHAAVFLLYLVLGLGVNFSTFQKSETWVFLLMLHSLVPLERYYFAINAPSWSVSVEVVLYLIFPLLLAASRRFLSAPLFIALIFLSISLGVANFVIQSHQPHEVSFGLLYISPFSRAMEFAMGMVAAKLFMQHSKPHLQIERPVASFFLELFCMAAAVSCLLYWPRVLDACHLPASLDALRIYLSLSGSALVFAPLVYVLAAERSLFSKILASRPFVWLGEVSFAIYMTHMLVLMLFGKYSLLNSGVPHLWLYALYLVAVLAVSALVHYCAERPAKKFFDTYFKKITA